MEKQNETETVNVSENNDKTISAVSYEKKQPRESVNVGRFKIPVFCISIFVLMLGFGGFITPILLLSILLFIMKVNNEKLTGNIITTLFLYAVQFIIETLVTFITSIPTSLTEWMSGFTQKTGTLEILSSISKGSTNVFGVFSVFVSIVFFVLYVIAIVSLCKSDRIQVPVFSEFLQKHLKKEHK